MSPYTLRTPSGHRSSTTVAAASGACITGTVPLYQPRCGNSISSMCASSSMRASIGRRAGHDQRMSTGPSHPTMWAVPQDALDGGGEDGAVAREEGYLLDNQQSEAGRRFDALSELFDPVTFRHLSAVGVSAGWACWEVGAGGVSVPAWLAEQVGPSGRVVATDIDTAWMPAEGAAFEVLRHDVGVDEAPMG